MRTIALINPKSPFLISDVVMPPLGLMYLSSYLKSKGIDATIFDMAVNGMKIEDIGRHDIFAFTATTPNYPVSCNAMKKLKNIYTDSLYVIGGPHATCFYENIKRDWDAVMVGEGERTLLEYVQNKIGGVISGFGREIEDLDTLPSPDRDFEGFERYNYELDGRKCTTAMTSRGCPYKCAFCCKTWSGGVRYHSADYVIKEAQLIKNMGFGAIMFYDDNMTLDRRRLSEICDGLKTHGLKWRCFVHANTINKDILKKMHDSGCIEVGMGVESGSNRILRIINKNITIERAKKAIEMCHEAGLRIKTFMIIGLPGENNDSVMETYNFLKESKPDDFDITIYTPFPSTDIWNNKSKYDVIFDPDSLDYSKMFYKGKAGSYCAQVSTSALSGEQIERYRDFIDKIKQGC